MAGIVAVLYNLVWGLPFLEMFQLSNYENGASRFHDLNWLDLGTALSPFDQGHPLLSGYHGAHYWVSTYFVGLPTLCLLLWGAFHSAYKKTSWGILPLLLVLSLGVLGAGHVLKAFLPGYALVIHSGFWLSLLVFWAAWLTMESAEDFIGRDLSPGHKGLWAGMVLGFTPYPFSSRLLYSPLPFGFPWGWLFFSRLAGKSQFPLGFGHDGPCSVSLGTAALSLNILLDRSYYEKPPPTMDLVSKPGRLFFTPPLLGRASRLQGANMAEAYESAKENLYPNWPLLYGKEEAPFYNTLQLRDSFAWTFQSFQYSLRHSRNVLNYLGIRYVFGKNYFEDFKNIESAGPIEISENPSPCPKWLSVSLAKAAGPSLLEDFAQADKTSMDYSRECFVGDPTKAGSYRPREVDWKQEVPTRLVVESKGSGESPLLVSSETNYPGWKVKVGDDSHIWRAGRLEQINHSFRGSCSGSRRDTGPFSLRTRDFSVGTFFYPAGFWLLDHSFFKRA